MNYRSLGNGINGAVECIDTLANILALTLGTSVTQTTVPAGSKARPTDVAGCTLEMGADGLWTGATVGTLTQAQADALVAAGVMGNVKVGTKSTVSTSDYSWNGVGWTAAYVGAVGTLYNGTTVPFPSPSAALLGMRIPVVNPAVPRRFSWLECNGTAWVPPSGELIVAVQPTSEASPVALVTPGVTTLVMIARSEIIPDYMLPNLLEWDVTGTISAQNATGTGACLLGIGISGKLPSVNNLANYPLNNNGAPPQVSPNFGGNDPNVSRRLQTRRGTYFRHPNNATRNFYDYTNQTGTFFVSGANRLYAMAAPDSITTIIRLDAMSAYSRGNL